MDATIIVWRRVVTAVLPAAGIFFTACAAEPTNFPDQPEPIEVEESALLGNVFGNAALGEFGVQCSPFFHAFFDRTAELVGHMLSSTAFRQCVDIRMRAQYMDCGDPGDLAIDGIHRAITRLFNRLEGGHYRYLCHTNPDPDLAHLYADRSPPGRLGDEFLMINAGARWREESSSWFDPPDNVWPWNDIVPETIHEYLHQRGYGHAADPVGCARDHGRTPDLAGYYLNGEPSAPGIVSSCAADVMTLSRVLLAVEGPAAGCDRDEIRLVSSWPRGGGPGSIGSYTFCSSDADCSGGARCALSGPDDPRGVCGTCNSEADCRGLGPTSHCKAGWCRDSRIIIPTTCVPNLRREVTMHSLATNQPVRDQASFGGSSTYLAANAPGRNPYRTSFWLTDDDRGQLLDGDRISLMSPGGKWIAPLAYLVEDDTSWLLTIRGSSPIGAGSTFWLESGPTVVVEAATGTTPLLRMTTDTTSPRRFFRLDSPSRKLVYLASPFWNRWTETTDGRLRSHASTLGPPPRSAAFWMLDHDGGKLRNGSAVSFQPLDDVNWWSTATNGEGQIVANRYWYNTRETFRVFCVTCGDTEDIKHGDIVALRAAGTSKYLTHTPFTPTDLYPSPVHAGGATVGSSQHMQIVEVSQYRDPTTPLDEVTRTTWIMD